MLNIDQFYDAELALDEDFILIRAHGRNVNVPLLFNKNVVHIDEELRKINLRWAMIYVAWSKDFNLDDGAYITPFVDEIDRTFQGVGEDILGVDHLESRFPGIHEVSRRAYRMSRRKSIPWELEDCSKMSWLSPKVFVKVENFENDHTKFTRDIWQAPQDKKKSFTELCFDARALVGEALDETLNVKRTNPVIFDLGLYVYLYNIFPCKYGTERSRFFVHEKDIETPHFIWKQTPNKVYIVTHIDGPRYEFSIITLDSNFLDIIHNSHKQIVTIDPLEVDFNAWLVIHIIETIAKANVRNTLTLERWLTSSFNSLNFDGTNLHPVFEDRVNYMLKKVRESSPHDNDGVGTHFRLASKFDAGAYYFPYPFKTTMESPEDFIQFNRNFSNAYKLWLSKLLNQKFWPPISMEGEIPEVTMPVFTGGLQLKDQPIEMYVPMSNKAREVLGNDYKYMRLVYKLYKYLISHSGQTSLRLTMEKGNADKNINFQIFARAKSERPADLDTPTEIQAFTKE